MLRKVNLALAMVVMILALTNESEAGGLFLTEFGTEDVALASAGWAARAQDASTLFKNPAGMSRLEGNQFQGGLQALYFQSGGFSGTNTPFGGNGGGNPIGVVPGASAFYVHSLGKDVKVGLGMVGNFGLGLKLAYPVGCQMGDPMLNFRHGPPWFSNDAPRISPGIC